MVPMIVCQLSQRTLFARPLLALILVTLGLVTLGLAGGVAAKELPSNPAVDTGVTDVASAELRALLAPVRSMQADFEQLVLDARQRVQQQTQGRLYLQQPLQLRWELAEPFPQLVVTDAANLYIYDPDLAQVNVEPLSEALAGTPALLLAGDLSGLDDQFRVYRQRDAEEIHFRLLPTASDALYTELWLIFADERLRQLEIHDSLGQRTLIRLRNLQINQTLATELFQFVIPPGTDVIGDVISTH